MVFDFKTQHNFFDKHSRTIFSKFIELYIKKKNHMKTFQNLIILFVTLCSFWAKGQHFELPIFFEDAIGNKDSIILGYDIAASKGIDAALGEIDILGTPYTKEIEVRASMYKYEKIRHEDPRIIESKKMIIESDCVYPTLYDEVNSIMVLIKSANWPIVISWDTTLFQDSCRAMAIVECEPGGWFDVCGGNNRFLVLEMEEINRFSFVRTVYTIPTETDTLFALFFPLSRKIDVGIVEPPSQNIVITYPNPVYDDSVVFRIEDRAYNDPNLTVKICNTLGSVISVNQINEEISTQSWSSGMYFFEISNGAKNVQTGKFLVVK